MNRSIIVLLLIATFTKVMSQKIGSRVILMADDGKTYTGTIKAVSREKNIK